LDGLLRCTANPHQSFSVALHRRIFLEPRADFTKNPGGVGVFGLDYAIVHPLSFATRSYDTRPSQISQMS
jgi:hypothetical protein